MGRVPVRLGLSGLWLQLGLWGIPLRRLLRATRVCRPRCLFRARLFCGPSPLPSRRCPPQLFLRLLPRMTIRNILDHSAFASALDGKFDVPIMFFSSARLGRTSLPEAIMFFSFPEDARWNAKREAVEFSVVLGHTRARYGCRSGRSKGCSKALRARIGALRHSTFSAPGLR